MSPGVVGHTNHQACSLDGTEGKRKEGSRCWRAPGILNGCIFSCPHLWTLVSSSSSPALRTHTSSSPGRFWAFSLGLALLVPLVLGLSDSWAEQWLGPSGPRGTDTQGGLSHPSSCSPSTTAPRMITHTCSIASVPLENMNQIMDCRQPPAAGRRQGTDSTSDPAEGNSPADAFISDFWPPEL